jgi:hypothetical protein
MPCGLSYSTLWRRTFYAVAFLTGLCTPLISNLTSWLLLRPTRYELTRIASPYTAEDGVLLETVAGLFKRRPVYEVFIVPHGGSVSGSRPVMSASEVTNLAISWREARMLTITYRRARIDQFMNYWPNLSTAGERAVEIRLLPLSGEFSILVPGHNPNECAAPPS